jgi:hypothetical protein
VQCRPRRQTRSQSLKLMGALPPETEGIEELVVSALHDLADRGHPPSEWLGPSLFGVSFGRMDDSSSVVVEPLEVVFGAFEALVGHVRSRRSRTHADEPFVGIGPHGEEGLKAICWSAVEAAPKQKPVMTLVGSAEVSKLKPSYQPMLLDQPMCRHLRQAISAHGACSPGWASPSYRGPRKNTCGPPKGSPDARRKPR